MNAPDRYEKFVVPEHLLKVEVRKDTKVADAATFVIQREDHTVGNLVRMQLLEDKDIMFAGYKIPHPLQYQLLIKVQTNGSKTPQRAVQSAIGSLEEELRDIREKFLADVARFGSGEESMLA
ncbi:hypothetical protein WJX74_006613 [Apatococcus lobatus]|uniref:DNA-directed RNA polymerase RBP11-like dimerisation domain-containing protein n=2 Tax=Apatococcus TaxID=904362 RepID=A0AAW1SP32_9CHLO